MSLADILASSLNQAQLRRSARVNPMLAQAVNEAAVRYSPAFDNLDFLRQQADQQYRFGAGQAQSAAQLQSALGREAQVSLDNAATNPLIARLTANANAVPGSSGAVVAQNLGLSHAATESMLAQAQANAPLRAQQEVRQLGLQNMMDKQRINSQQAAALGQAGQYITGRVNQLGVEDRKFRQQADIAASRVKATLLSHGINPATGTYDPSLKPPPKPPKPPAGPSTIAKPPANYPGSPADWNNASRADRERWLTNHPTGRSGTGAAKPTLPPAQATKYTSQAEQVADILLHPPPLQGGGVASRQQILSEIRAGTSPLGKGVDPRVVHVGTSLADNKGKGIGPWGLQNAQDLGIPVKWKVLPKPRRSVQTRVPIGPAGPISS